MRLEAELEAARRELDRRERDVKELAAIERSGDLRRLLSLLAGRSGGILVPAGMMELASKVLDGRLGMGELSFHVFPGGGLRADGLPSTSQRIDWLRRHRSWNGPCI